MRYGVATIEISKYEITGCGLPFLRASDDCDAEKSSRRLATSRWKALGNCAGIGGAAAGFGSLTTASRSSRCVTATRGNTVRYSHSRFLSAARRSGLKDREDTTTLTVAKKMIDLAARGERDPERLTAETVRALRRSSRDPSSSPVRYREYARLCRDIMDRMPEHRQTLSDLADAWERVACEEGPGTS
jgi:hypothetical protein